VSESGQQPTDPQEPEAEALDPALSALALIAGRISAPVKLFEAGPSEPVRPSRAKSEAPVEESAAEALRSKPPSPQPVPQPARPAHPARPWTPKPDPALKPELAQPSPPSPATGRAAASSREEEALQPEPPAQPLAEPDARTDDPVPEPDTTPVVGAVSAPTPEPKPALVSTEASGADPELQAPTPVPEPTPVAPPPKRFNPQRPALDQVAERLREGPASAEPSVHSGADFQLNAERIVPRRAPQPRLEDDAVQGAEPPVARPNRLVLSIAVLSIVFGLGAMVASAWVYSEAQRDLRQLSSDLAHMRVSLELFARQQTEGGDLDEVYGRLQQVEQSMRDAIAAIPTQQGAPGTTPIPVVGLGPSAQSDGDCLPPGTRFLVTTGDRYPICGTQGVLEILSVGALDIALGDGSAVAIGGSTTLPNTSCTVSVLSANADGMSGYGEIRVNC